MLSAHSYGDTDEPLPKPTTKESELFKFDVTIVFGQGPIKPILLPTEATPEQQRAWENYQQDTHRYEEPNFWIMHQPRYLAQLEKIAADETLSDEKKASLRDETIINWQKTGWFALKQWGRQNALAAGCALYTGLTKEIVLTGGRTMCRWVKDELPEKRLSAWPSEAELMLDIIKRYYGDLYKKRFNQDIESVIHLEDKAMNTLENFSYTINRHPALLREDMRVGFLSVEHHLKRVSLLAQLFSIRQADESKLSAREILAKQGVSLPDLKDQTDEVLECVRLCQESKLTVEYEQNEKRFIGALQDPNYLSYWFGYLGDVNNPRIIQKAMKRLNQPEWVEVASSVFKQVGLNMREYQQADLYELSKQNPDKYFMLVEGLKKLKKPEFRKVPVHATV